MGSGGGNLGVRCEEKGRCQKEEFGLDSLAWERAPALAVSQDSVRTKENPPFPPQKCPPSHLCQTRNGIVIRCCVSPAVIT